MADSPERCDSPEEMSFSDEKDLEVAAPRTPRVKVPSIVTARAAHPRPRSATFSVSSPGPPSIAGATTIRPRNARFITRSATMTTVIGGYQTEDELKTAYMYPNPTLMPHFGRKHTTLIAISGAIGTGLFLGSGTPLSQAGPLGLLMGYALMSSVVYGMIVSSSEMVAVFPYCRGTVGLADRFVDPSLGFAMGWNAWYHWGIIIPSQLSAATALIKYWNPPSYLVTLWPPLLIILVSWSVFGARIYGEMASVFALIKVCAVIILVILALVIDGEAGARHDDPFKYWKDPFQQYLNIPGAWGRALGVFAVLIQAAVSFFGTEIPSLIAGEVKDAPRVIYDVSKRMWARLSFLYAVCLFIGGTLVSPKSMGTHKLDPSNPNSPEDDAPWDYSPFLVALQMAGRRYNWVSNLCIAMFISSAASAASTEIFISSRYLYYLAKAGHAPKYFGEVWPNTDEAKRKGAIVPWVGVATTVAFSTLTFLSMRPHLNTASGHEKVFKFITSMTSAACLQAWVGTLFTYLRFHYGTKHPKNELDYGKEIERIKQNRARGQPYWAMYSFAMCIAILVFNGWSLFNSNNGRWVIYATPEIGEFPRDQVIKFITTYLPIPLFLILLFGYKLIVQSPMIRCKEMNFSGVAFVDYDKPPHEPYPTSILGRIWWFLVK